MKRLFGILLPLLICISSTYAFDFSKESSNGQILYYNINTDGYSVTITYPNTAITPWEGYTLPSGSLVIPTQVIHGGATYAVTAIGNSALANCGTLTLLAIPSSITSIATDAFFNTNIDTLLFEASACANRLKQEVFGNVSHLHIGGQVLQIPTQAFKDDTLLQSVVFDSIATIGIRAFKNCNNLRTIILPNTLTSISAEAFVNCSNLMEVRYLGTLSDWCHIQFGDSLANPTSQSHSLNINGEDLQRLIIPNDIHSITSYTFYGCSSIHYISLPTHVTNIAPYAFTNINPDTLYFYATNNDSRLAKHTFGHVRHLFAGGNVETIGTNSFANDTALTTVTIESAQSIGMYAFRNCFNLETLNLSATIDSIRNAAFANCIRLSVINIQRTLPPYIDSDAFSNTLSSKIINIPCGSLLAYQNDWNGGGILAEPDTYSVIALSADSTMGYTQSTQPQCDDPSATIEALPFSGYRFLSWGDGDTTNPRGITVTQDTAFTAFFAPNIYAVNAMSSDSTQGSVIGGGDYTYLGTATLIATPAEHHHFMYWQDGNTENPRHVTVLEDTVFTAFFAIDSHYVVLHNNNGNYGTLYGDGIYPYGDTIILTAQANPHHHFVCWQDGDTTTTKQIVVTQNYTFEGTFQTDSHTVVLQSNNPHYGTISGAGDYPYGSTVTIAALPSQHYHFMYWQDGETVNPRQITITSDTLFIATFAIDSHTVVLGVNDVLCGDVEGDGIYAYETLVQISATAFDGYTFTCWSNGITDNPYQLLLTSDTLITAVFATVEDISQIADNNITYYVIGCNVYLKGAAGKRLQFFDLSGRLLYTGEAKDGKAYPLPQKGVYCLRIGDDFIQKIIVP